MLLKALLFIPIIIALKLITILNHGRPDVFCEHYVDDILCLSDYILTCFFLLIHYSQNLINSNETGNQNTQEREQHKVKGECFF